MHDFTPRYRSLCLARGAPLVVVCLTACPPEPMATSTDTSPSTSVGTTSLEATLTAAMTSGPDTTGGVVTEPTTSSASSTTGTAGTTSTGDSGGSTVGVDGSTGSSTSSGSSTTTIDEASSGGPGSSSTAAQDTCGDGVLDFGELCDDGNKASGDGCLPDCTPGIGAALGPIDLPAQDPTGLRRCMTLLGGTLSHPLEHGLVLGGPLFYYGPDGQRAAHVEQFPLPAANPVMWSWAEYAGAYDRSIDKLATAENGDILAAGTVYTNPQYSSGFLWLARFTPDGELVWLRDHESIASTPVDLASSPSGDILVAATFVGWAKAAKGAWVQAFDADGALLWQHAAPIADEWRLQYTGIVVASDATIYVSGRGGAADKSFENLVLQSFTADGTPLWQTEIPSANYPQAIPAGLTITTEGVLVVPVTQGANDWAGEDAALAAFDTAGELLWWRDMHTKKPGWYPYAGPIVAAPNGGVIVLWGDSINEDAVHGRIARHSASGETLWEIDPAGTYVVDAALGADGLLYVLQDQEVHRYAP